MKPSRRRLIRRFVALACVAWLPLHSVTAAEGSAATVDVKAVQVAERSYIVQGHSALGTPANENFISNSGFVVTDDGVVVVDALGSPPLARRMLAEIRRITPKPIRYVVLTHYHADHIYGLQVFKDAGAEIIAHALGREYLYSDAAQQRLAASRKDLSPAIDADTRLVPADLWVGSSEPRADTVLQLGGIEFIVRPMGPSHTSEDLAVFVPSLGVLFCGDLLFRGRIPFVGQADSGGWIRALDRMLTMKPKVVVPGHGPASTDPLADMTLTRDYLAYLRETMGRAAQDMQPFDETYASTDWSRFARVPLFDAANRMNAYNTYLLMESEQMGRKRP
jgi:glyoxylase-like metal-dependent hydrolase (beta-lactamase superfamily II)